MRVFKTYLYKLQTKERNSFIYFAHTSLSLFKTFSNSNEKFSITFEDDVVSLMWYFAEVRTFEFFTTRSSNITYRRFSFFFSNFFFTNLFIFIFADFSSTFIVFFFLLSFFHLFAAVSQHWAEKSFQQLILSSSLNVFEENDFLAEIVSL